VSGDGIPGSDRLCERARLSYIVRIALIMGAPKLLLLELTRMCSVYLRLQTTLRSL
jgi:hypothetical protein